MVAKNNITFGKNHPKFKNICIVSLRITNQICKIILEFIMFNYYLESCGLFYRSTYFPRVIYFVGQHIFLENFLSSIHFL